MAGWLVGWLVGGVAQNCHFRCGWSVRGCLVLARKSNLTYHRLQYPHPTTLHHPTITQQRPIITNNNNNPALHSQ
jgi:hypothetical protein